MVIIKSTFVRILKASAFTVCPFIFVDPDCVGDKHLIAHERVHWWHQLWWGLVGSILGAAIWVVLGWPLQPASALLAMLGLVEGWVSGVMLWRAAYLLLLPVGWNPLRRWTETQAYRLAEHYSDSYISELLKKPPYLLWWM